MSEIGSAEICVKEKKSLPETIREELINLRDNYSEEIPVEMMHGNTDPGNYKVLREWSTALISYFDAARKIIMDPKANRKIYRCMHYFSSEKFHKQERTTAKDIRRLNGMINFVLEKI